MPWVLFILGLVVVGVTAPSIFVVSAVGIALGIGMIVGGLIVGGRQRIMEDFVRELDRRGLGTPSGGPEN